MSPTGRRHAGMALSCSGTSFIYLPKSLEDLAVMWVLQKKSYAAISTREEWTLLFGGFLQRDHTTGGFINDKFCVLGGRIGNTVAYYTFESMIREILQHLLQF